MYTNTKNTPIEALERRFPLRVLRYRLPRCWPAPHVVQMLTPGGGGWGAR